MLISSLRCSRGFTGLSWFGAALALLLQPAAVVPLAAQSATSREVVQPLPSREEQALNRALVALARRPGDFDALLEAGDAALALGDLDAASGFFVRAAQINPERPGPELGKAQIALRRGSAIEALAALDKAQENGGTAATMLGDRGLALDMLGLPQRAQQSYRKALEKDDSLDEVRRRFALSQAISGRAREAEALLQPLLAKREPSAFRTRVFALSILGENDRAAAITGAVMPPDLAADMMPYLEIMPKLTAAQQAAAANLGIFPQLADVGQDPPAMLAYREGLEGQLASRGSSAAQPSRMAVKSGDLRLAPVGRALGEASAGAPSPAASSATKEAGLSSANPLPPIAPSSRQTAALPASATAPAANPEAKAASPSRIAEVDRASGSVSSGPVSSGSEETAIPAPTAGATQRLPTSVKPAQRRLAVSDAFADLAGAAPAIAKRPDPQSVDLAAIDIPVEQPAPKEPPKPKHPSRVWVQVATGSKLSGLRFDWRRITRKADGLLDDYAPHIVPWGVANRLLAGPLPSRGDAQDLVNELKAKGLDTFYHVSDEGVEINKL